MKSSILAVCCLFATACANGGPGWDGELDLPDAGSSDSSSEGGWHDLPGLPFPGPPVLPQEAGVSDSGSCALAPTGTFYGNWAKLLDQCVGDDISPTYVYFSCTNGTAHCGMPSGGAQYNTTGAPSPDCRVSGQANINKNGPLVFDCASAPCVVYGPAAYPDGAIASWVWECPDNINTPPASANCKLISSSGIYACETGY